MFVILFIFLGLGLKKSEKYIKDSISSSVKAQMSSLRRVATGFFTSELEAGAGSSCTFECEVDNFMPINTVARGGG